MLKVLFFYILANIIVNLINITSKKKITYIFFSCLIINVALYETLIIFFERSLLLVFYIIIILNFYTIWNSSVRLKIIKKKLENKKYDNEDLLKSRLERFQDNNITLMQKNIFLFIFKIKSFFLWIINEK